MSATLDDFCPACGYRRPPGAPACPDCGTRFAPAPPSAAADPPAAAAPPPAVPSPAPASSAPAVPPPPAAPGAPQVRTPLTAALLGAVPTEAPPAEAPPADAPPGYATVWPPVSAVQKAAPVPEPPAPEPEAPAMVVPAVEPPPPVPPPPPDMARPEPPPPPRERRPVDRRVVLGVGGAVLLIALAGLALALIPHGAAAPRRAAALGTPTATPTATAKPKAVPKLAAQVVSLDALMRLSARGRAAAVQGDFAAATARRAALLRRVDALRAHVRDPALRAGLTSFAAAVTEALDQNRGCKAACSSEDLAKVGRLKQRALDRLNPLLRRYAHTQYKRAQI